MRLVRCAPSVRAALIALVVAAAVVPVAAQAQTAPPARERLTQFTKAHIAINIARDEFHGKVARIHEAQGRERARREMEAQVGEILSDTAMTQEEYDEFILIISLDSESRAMFDEILVELAEEGSAPTY